MLGAPNHDSTPRLYELEDILHHEGTTWHFSVRQDTSALAAPSEGSLAELRLVRSWEPLRCLRQLMYFAGGYCRIHPDVTGVAAWEPRNTEYRGDSVPWILVQGNNGA
jgi:hypothetical protein